MPIDIVERLRERHCSEPHCWAWRHEGADEIERLRAELRERAEWQAAVEERGEIPMVCAHVPLCDGNVCWRCEWVWECGQCPICCGCVEDRR